MFEEELQKVEKEKLVELCNEMLEEAWHTGAMSHHSIKKMLEESLDKTDNSD